VVDARVRDMKISAHRHIFVRIHELPFIGVKSAPSAAFEWQAHAPRGVCTEREQSARERKSERNRESEREREREREKTRVCQRREIPGAGADSIHVHAPRSEHPPKERRERVQMQGVQC
jgi:hypothetical protein